MKKKIRVLIVDDHFVVRMGVATSIDAEPDMFVVGEATTGEEALDTFVRHAPDVVLMDLRLPGMDGLQATEQLCRRHPDAKVIILTSFDSEEDVYRALQAGARSYLSKNVLRADLLRTIREVQAGQHALPAAPAARLAERMRRPELSPRELDVLKLIVKGRANKEIATALLITEFTVKLHVHNLLSKLNVADRTHASTVALQRGIVHLE